MDPPAPPSSNTHAIVTFTDEGSVEVVPISWISDGGIKCAWPDKSSKETKRMVRKSHEVSKNWIQHNCRVLGRFVSYQDARAMLPTAQYTSDLSDNEGHASRTKSSSTLPLPPNALTNATDPSEPTNVIPESTKSTTNEDNEQSVLYINSYEPEDNGNNEIRLLLAGTETGLMTTSNVEKYLHDILIKLESMETVMKEQSDHIKDLSGQLAALSTEKMLQSTYLFDPDYFPLKSAGDVDALNNLILESSEAYSKLVQTMKLCGGGTVVEAVKFILTSLMTDDVLANLCYEGTSQKRTFTSFDRLLNCMLDSLSCNPRTKAEATKDVLKAAIQKALKQASDRVAQRKKQAARNASRQTEES